MAIRCSLPWPVRKVSADCEFATPSDFNRERVEYVSVPESYLYYPVSCSTDAQYRAVQEAFSSSGALKDPEDPRQIIFTVLPGHGVVIVEKWVDGKRPFQVIWEGMDERDIEISNDIPQGPFAFQMEGQRATLAGDVHSMNFHAHDAHEAHEH